jgi:ornithine decarboxylase
MNDNLTTISAFADTIPPKPFFAFRPATLEKAVSFFTRNLKATCLFAVKTNPEDYILKALNGHGIQCFDVASLDEITRVKRLLPEAKMYFMHPVKARYAIREAYFSHGIRDFSLDCEDELQKILEETDYATDLSLHIRLSIPNAYAELSLSEKFGVNLQEAPELIEKTARHAKKVGICFHAGSQCMHPDAYRIAIRMAGQVVAQSGVAINSFDVGGGFPSVYPGMIPPDMSEYFDAIHDEFAQIPGHEFMELLAEPGRALVAESTSLVVRVELRKGNMLYINDGTYGSLFDAGTPKFIFPVQLLSNKLSNSSDLVPFSFYGPTCDSLDFMKGPFYLPQEVGEGDYIEIGQMGAYGRTMATGFNGFGAQEKPVHVSDAPLMTMYDDDRVTYEKLEVIAA